MADVEANKLDQQKSTGSLLLMKPQKLWVAAQICFRVLIVLTTLAATSITLTNKQTIHLGVFVMDARYSYSSATKFFAFANIAGSVFTLASLLFVLLFNHRGSDPAHYFILFLSDLVITCLVLSGCAAATAIGMVGKNGNSHTGWMPICDHFATYCNRSTTSIGLSYVSVFLLLTVTIMSANSSRQIHHV